MTIKVLDSKVVSQIAAGEVVERPSSVVKELVENSLDAGSTQISIEIKNGGISLISVNDNGSGIPDNETEIAFKRHATSKIDRLNDLQELSTLGFRGEALPSIASVSQVELLTCNRGKAAGTYLSLEEGKIVRHDIQARSPGTTIIVRNLFRRVPARLKFLKSEAAEGSRVAEIASRYALAYPEVKFTLISNGKTTLHTPGSGKLMDSVIAIYGLEAAKAMIEISSGQQEWDNGRMAPAVSGLAGSPQISRSGRERLSFYVNRRWVNNHMLSFAVEEAYHGLLMQGKHPVAIVNLAIPPDEVDVNVHPAKTEVKFQDEKAVFAAVQRAVRQALVRSSPVPQIEEVRPRFSVPSSPFSIPAAPAYVPPSRQAVSPAQPEPLSPTPLMSLPLLRVLGQLARNYIVAEGPDGLFLIDQHAAHERIMLEKIINQQESRKVEVQGLLEPATFEVEPQQVPFMNSRLQELNGLGFTIEPFGDRTFLVRSVPAVLSDRDWMAMLKEIISNSSASRLENLNITLACHSAIRAGQILSDSEMRELVRQLEQTSLPNSCPHGRPTMIQLTIQKLEREFGRS